MGACQLREHPGQPHLRAFGLLTPSFGHVVRRVPIDAVAGDRDQPEALAASQRLAGEQSGGPERGDPAPRGVAGVANLAGNPQTRAHRRTEPVRADDDVRLRPPAASEAHRYTVRTLSHTQAFVIEVDGDVPRRVAQHLEQLRAVKHRDRHAESRDEFA